MIFMKLRYSPHDSSLMWIMSTKYLSKAKVKKIFETKEHIFLIGTLYNITHTLQTISDKSYLDYRCAILAYSIRATGATTG